METTICLLNDSFPPVIDGVANAVMNYGRHLSSCNKQSIVITPDHPKADDSAFEYTVLRYPSLDLRKATGYMAGIPFAPDILHQLQQRNIGLLHSHCPIVSTMLAREFRQVLDVPLVLTYHTKFDIDIANILHSAALQEGSKRALLENMNACDEIWTVSQGAAENLRSLGYEGECIIMPNGVDIPQGRVNQERIREATREYDLPADVPVYLFVGRIMWYKGLRTILDALSKLNHMKKDFRMVFIGTGGDFEQVYQYTKALGLAEKVFFPGAIHDREILRAWYCRANLFLFPSTFDTNGLVVREAAACGVASVLIAGSCAAEGVTPDRNGLLIDENADSMAACLQHLSMEAMAVLGENAQKELYLSWQDAVKAASQRYDIVMENYRCGTYPKYRHHLEPFFRANGELMAGLGKLEELRNHRKAHINEILQESREHIKDVLSEKNPLKSTLEMKKAAKTMRTIYIPEHYAPKLDAYDTQRAIAYIKQTFQQEFSNALNLKRVSAPLFVTENSGLNDNLNGYERPVSFDIPAVGADAQVVHSLAKWKRLALKRYGFTVGNGLYTDMNAIRRDETLDNIHSIYVDQWDWEKVITRENRNLDYLKLIVEAIVRTICDTNDRLHVRFPQLTLRLERKVSFITTQELEDLYPDLTPSQRENAYVKEHPTSCIMQIGGALKSGKPHDGRAPDYDDWQLNCDIFFWDPVLNRALEISSMGIRVDAQALDRQLTIANCDDRRALPFHQMLLNDQLPLTIGGGIGQSRLAMLLMGCAHIGEVQSSIWDNETISICERAGIPLL